MIINFVGDFCLYGIQADSFRVDQRILDIFEKGDLNVANLESALTLRDKPRHYVPVALKAEPSHNRIIDLFDVFSLANNHVFDYGLDGFRDTIGFLEEDGKKYFGAGTDLESSYIPLKVEKNSNKIAFLGFTRWGNAGRNNPGTTPARQNSLSRRIRSLKDEGCFVIVMPHWNYEYVYFPAPDNRKMARKLIDAGADLIIGSHPHIVQGYEEYRDKYIFHSLGNFIFHSKVFESISMIENDPRLKFTFILTVNLKEKFDYNFEITPLFTDDHQLRLLNTEEKVFVNKLTEISEILNNKKEYSKSFYRDAANISDQTTKMLKKLAVERGLMSLLSSFKRVKKQDMKIKLYSFFQKRKY